MSDDEGTRADERRARSKKRRRKKTKDADESAAEEAPKRRRKKKKREASESPQNPPDDRPVFARSYPHHHQLDRLVTAFDRGDFARVRAEAPGLMDGEEDEAIKRAAADLRRRIDPAPTSVFLWALGVALLVFLYGFFVSHSH